MSRLVMSFNAPLRAKQLAAVAALPLMLAAGSAMAQSHHDHSAHAKPAETPKTQAADPHAGHDMGGHADHSAHQAADPHAGHDMGSHADHSAHQAADPHAGHDMGSHADHSAHQAADPHAGHDMGSHADHSAHQAADPHAGHDMGGHADHSAHQAADPHAGHDMGGHADHSAHQAADPHAGHDMSGHADHSAHQAADPHAGHDMGGHEDHSAHQAADPHAGHDMGGHEDHSAHQAADPHAGHDMGGHGDHSAHAGHGASGLINVPTSVDAVGGRLVETPPPPAAFAGPAHAADLLFDPEVMAASRRQLLVENGAVRVTGIKLDHLEIGFGEGETEYGWSLQGYTGGDINRFWWKTAGEGAFNGRLHEVELQALYSRAIAPFWDVQAGLAQTIRPDAKDTTSLTVGLQGVAPYWFETSAAAFLSSKGDLTAHVEAEYDLRLTQKWILQPLVEVAMAGSDILEEGKRAGLTSVTAGLRLRYEIKKEFAPYAGVEWSRDLGKTADLSRSEGHDVEDFRFVVGLKAWY